MNVLLIGGGGREHALAWKLRRSPRVNELWVTHPNNPGLASLGQKAPFEPGDKNAFALQRFCDEKRIELVVIGPEDPLVAGLADRLATTGRAVLGPGAAGARLEADKAWTKQLLRGASIPTAEAHIFTDVALAKAYVESRQDDLVIKASGLARGKGVIVAASQADACAAIDRIMVERVFGEAGDTIVIEEKLQGAEVSVLALVDGRTIYMLETCQDHKRLLEGGAGPNTGGMGACCPASCVDDDAISRIEREVLVPAVDALRREGVVYQGVLYAGIMLTHAGPKVLEFNVRFGDPECQPLMMRLQGDLADLLHRTATGRLEGASISWDPRPACCVVLAGRGYPDKPETGFAITGVEVAQAMNDVEVFHAGTRLDDSGALVTAGGRVLSVTALGDTPEAARELALRACDMIHFEGKHLRRDIGAAALPSQTHAGA